MLNEFVLQVNLDSFSRRVASQDNHCRVNASMPNQLELWIRGIVSLLLVAVLVALSVLAQRAFSDCSLASSSVKWFYTCQQQVTETPMLVRRICLGYHRLQPKYS